MDLLMKPPTFQQLCLCFSTFLHEVFPSQGELTAFVSDVHLLPRVSSPHCTSVLIAEAACGTAGMQPGRGSPALQPRVGHMLSNHPTCGMGVGEKRPGSDTVLLTELLLGGDILNVRSVAETAAE